MPTGFEILDQPQILPYLFHPRTDSGYRSADAERIDLMIPVTENVAIGASFHRSGPEDPVIIFFHGNGEIVSDYDDLGRVFASRGLNFLVADYRGYGGSGGQPTASAMVSDSLKVFDFVKNMMAAENFTGTFCVMGRSLGSASALEIAVSRQGCFDRLVIESGFAKAGPLLQTLGIRGGASLQLDQGLENIDKMKKSLTPCLVIHAEYDHIIPFSDGQALYDACPAPDKSLLKIKGANHNDIFLKGMTPYLENLEKICKKS